MNESNIYYQDFYWNNLEIVQEHLNKLISGDKNIGYIKNFSIQTNRKFEKALVLNCGNGHVERDFIKQNVVNSAIGIDISEDLIKFANEKKGNMEIEYILCDINKFKFDSINFDLLIVFAAGHHIKCLNKVFSEASRQLGKNNGMIVGFDYIGPHRNQYPYDVWEKMHIYNKQLPKELQNNLVYPHLPTMLATDPSEAIHSELLEENLNFYFDLNFSMLGGGIAYEILCHNIAIQKMNNDAKNKDYLNEQVLRILNWDLKEAKKDHRFNFFTSFYGFPKKLLDKEIVKERVSEENIYEKKYPLGANYYERTFLQNLTEELAHQKLTVLHKEDYIEKIHKKINK